MKIIGIDPGYDRCGIAIVERTQQGEQLLFSDCIVTDRKATFPERLVQVCNAFIAATQTHTPNACALEKVYFTTNQKTAMQVAEVRGALLYLSQVARLTIVEYTPNEIKVAIAGDGRADKKQVIFMVPRLVCVKKEITYDDEYDAIAVALTASASLRSAL